MWKEKNVSSSDSCWTLDVLRQEIELNHQGPLKLALDAKFNIRSGIWKKMFQLVYFFLSYRKLKHR